MRLIHVDEPEHKEEIVRKQAEEILRIKPDIILFEFPKQKTRSLSDFNQFKPNEKPKQRAEELKQSYKRASEKYPWLKSEYKIIEAIEQLWSEGKQVYLFEIDGPIELTCSGERTGGLLNIVWNYLRERYMAENINKIRKKVKGKTALILCHNFHWKNIQFLLKNPNKDKIWDYYFTKNRVTKSPKDVKLELKENAKVLYKYWNLKSDF